MSSTRRRGAGQSKRIPTSSTTTACPEAGTSRRGSSRNSCHRSCARPSGRCVSYGDQMGTEVGAPRAETNTSLGALKQVKTGELNIAYAEVGPPDGPAVSLLHGWPYDIHSYVDVVSLLAARGYRSIVPYLR